MNKATTPPTPSNRATPDVLLLRKRYQRLTRKHLGSHRARLFAEYTGLHFHTAWASAGAQDWGPWTSSARGSVCCRLAEASPEAQAVCQACGPTQLARALSNDGEGLCFKCRLGVRNYWLPVRVRGLTIGIAYLQAPDRTQPEQTARKRSLGAAPKVLTQSEFQRAGRLLRLIVEEVQTWDLAELGKADLTNAEHAVRALEKEQTRLHKTEKRQLPAPSSVVHRAHLETQPEQLVQSLLKCISQKFVQPITLRRCAAKLGRNPAYLSALFTRATGRSFKACLIEMRIEKAKALLSDPAKFIAEVAYAVGYAGENQFRIAFKKATGLAPKIWRETLRIKITGIP